MSGKLRAAFDSYLTRLPIRTQRGIKSSHTLNGMSFTEETFYAGYVAGVQAERAEVEKRKPAPTASGNDATAPSDEKNEVEAALLSREVK